MKPEIGWKERYAFKGYDLLYSSTPGLLPESERSAIIADLIEALPEMDVRQYFASQPRIFDSYSQLVIALESNSSKTIGLLGCKWLVVRDTPFFLLMSAMAADRYQRGGMFRSVMARSLLNIETLGHGFPQFFGMKSTNAQVYRILLDLQACVQSSVPSLQLYPDLSGGEQDPRLRDIAAGLAQLLLPDRPINLNTGVIAGAMAMAPEFYPTVPMSGDPKVDAYFSKYVTANDQLVSIVHCPPGVKDPGFKILRAVSAAGKRVEL